MVSFMIPLIRKFRSKLESYPCLILLSGVLNGFPAVYFSGGPLTVGNIFLYAVPGLLLAWLIFGLQKSCCRFIPATLLAIFSSILLMTGESRSFQKTENIHDRMGAAAVFRLTDSSLCGGTPEWIPNAPYFIQAELKSAAIGNSGEMTPAAGKVLLTVSYHSGGIRHAGYGDLIRAEGYFETIPEQILPGTFDFPAYASARGSSLLFHAESVQVLKRGNGFLRFLFDWRSHFLSKLCSKLPDGAARDMAPALLFGIRQPIKGRIKNDFLYSGTLHVLSVSGFHVGLFFLAMMFFCSALPYRIRWSLAPFPVLLYTLSTGIQAPAFRAFLMLTLWCLAHLFLRNNKGMNTLAVAAAIILLLNPYQLFDVGFIYSFLCVFFLILSSDFFHRIAGAITVRENFLPNRRRISFRRLMSIFVVSAGVSVAAWLCSLVVSLHYQSLFTPWAVPAYLLMLPVTWYCFALFLPAILLQWIPGVPEFLGVMIAPSLKLCAAIAEQFADSGAFYTAPPPKWLGIIFLSALAGVLCFKRKPLFAAAAVILFLSGFFLFFRNPVPEIVILKNGAAAEPAILFCNPASQSAIVWNVPQGETARLISDYLKTGGINRISEVHFDSAKSELCGGGNFLFSIYPPEAVYFHGKIRKNAETARRLRRKYPEPVSRPLLKLSREKNYVEVIPRIAGMEQVKLRKIISPDKGITLEITHSGQTLRREYPFSNKITAEQITLPAHRKAEWKSLLSTEIHPEFPR